MVIEPTIETLTALQTDNIETLRRINVTFPVEILDILDKLLPARQRNHFIVEATRQAIQRAHLEIALKQLAQDIAWKNDDHPELESLEDMDRYVRELRESWCSTENAVEGE